MPLVEVNGTSMVTVFGRPAAAISASMFSPLSKACSHLMICATPYRDNKICSVSVTQGRMLILTFDEDVDQFDFGLAQSVGVGDIPGATSGGRVNTSGTSGLETHAAEEVLEVLAARDQWDLDHSTSTETSTQVGWASENPSQVVGVHEVVTFGLQASLNGGGGLGESFDDSLDIVTLFHGDDSHLIFFIDPDEKVFVVVVEDTTGIWPVAT